MQAAREITNFVISVGRDDNAQSISLYARGFLCSWNEQRPLMLVNFACTRKGEDVTQKLNVRIKLGIPQNNFETKLDLDD